MNDQRRPPPRSRSSVSASLSLSSAGPSSARRRPATWCMRSLSGSLDRPSSISGASRRQRAPKPRGVAAVGRRKAQDVVLGVSLLYCQATLMVMYLGAVRYEKHADASEARNSLHPTYGGFVQDSAAIVTYFSMFQDVHVMIFVGFGFLMMFLRKYGFSAVGFTLLLAALMVQWAVLCQGFFRLNPQDGKIHLGITSLLNADIASAAVLISMGAVLGKTTPLQLVVMGVIEMACFAGNEYLGGHIFKAVDLGGSMFVHVFGAYFGLAVSRILGRPTKSNGEENANEGSSYTSDMFAMVGTVFLWLFWPSFNGALAVGHARQRAVINTYLALTSCCVTAFAVSSLTQREAKFNMVHVQNATLAGGVAVGTTADLMIMPVGALIIGCLAGALSVVGYAYLQPILLKRLKVHDTCGVHNLHGMPGVMAGIIGAIMAAIATTDTYGNSLYLQFPARTPQNATLLAEIRSDLPGVPEGDSRTAGLQAAYQLLALFVTMALSVITGTVTGLVTRSLGGVKGVHPPGVTVVDEQMFSDMPFWEVHDEKAPTLGPQMVMPELMHAGFVMKQSTLLRQPASHEHFDDALHWEVPDDVSPASTRKISAASMEAGDDRAGDARHHVATISGALDGSRQNYNKS